MAERPHRFDVFCRVVDNYGDAGVALRLARALVHEHDAEVRLWIDDLASLARIAPGLDPAVGVQRHDGIDVRAIGDASDGERTPQVVIEAFGCGLPEGYLDLLERAPVPPVWLNLEYLSAERWVEGVHGLPSPPPRRKLQRWFYFPGFGEGTGGLIREHGLIAERDRYRCAADARDEAWRQSGLAPPGRNTLAVSLFCYPNPALPALFEAWADDDSQVACLIPEGTATAALDRYFGGAVPHAGEARTVGALTLVVAPFVDQHAFDRRLWSCDLNFVRGEDSFVRAQWAARPLVWHAYPQQDGAHFAKLDAFAERYTLGLDGAAAMALRRFWRAFNEGEAAATAAAWPRFREALTGIAGGAEAWANRQAAQPDLVTQLVDFARNRL